MPPSQQHMPPSPPVHEAAEAPAPAPALPPLSDGDWPALGSSVPDAHAQAGCQANANADHFGYCSGDWPLGMVADRVVLPRELKPGRYVVGWRMDCEETAQIW